MRITLIKTLCTVGCQRRGPGNLGRFMWSELLIHSARRALENVRLAFRDQYERERWNGYLTRKTDVNWRRGRNRTPFRTPLGASDPLTHESTWISNMNLNLRLWAATLSPEGRVIILPKFDMVKLGEPQPFRPPSKPRDHKYYWMLQVLDRTPLFHASMVLEYFSWIYLNANVSG